MSEPILSSVVLTKGVAAVVGTASAVEAAMKIVSTPDLMLFGLVPEPLFYSALAGASLGVLRMQDSAAATLAIPTGDTRTGKIIGLIFKMAGLGAMVLGFAGLAAGGIAAVREFLAGGPVLVSTAGWIGGTFVLSYFIKPLLPAIFKGLERMVGATVSAYERVIGAKQ